MLRIENLKLSPGGGLPALRAEVLHILRIQENALLSLHILRRSIDAREGIRMVYTVEAEVLEHDGNVGDVKIFSRLLNGFKVAYDGSAKTATIKLRIKGGM